MLRLGKSQIGHIKDHRIGPNVGMNEKLIKFRGRLNPFYSNKGINLVTEDQVRSGVEALEINTSREHEGNNNMKFVQKGVKLLNHKDSERVLRQRDTTSVQSYMAASLVENNPEKIRGVDGVLA